MKATLLSFALVLSCSAAFAAQNPLAQPCAAEINQYCRTIPVVGHAGCLNAVSANLSQACRTAVTQAMATQAPQGNTSGVGAQSTPPQGGAARGGGGGGDGY
jgi:hypothetical protein